MNDNFTTSNYVGAVFSAGGIKGFYELGVFQYYHNMGFFHKANVFSGTSIGSLIAALYIIGFDPIDILMQLESIPLISSSDFDLTGLNKHYGLYKTDRLRHAIENIFKLKFKNIPTLQELYEKTRKHLIICVYNVTRTRSEYFSWKTEPDLLITDAIIASCTIPTLFQPLHYKGNLYIDGARGAICPLEYTLEYMQPYYETDTISNKLLCLVFEERECRGFYEFLHNMMVTRNIKKEDVVKYKTADIVFLPNEYVPYDTDAKEKRLLFDKGFGFIKALVDGNAVAIKMVREAADLKIPRNVVRKRH